MTESPGRVAAGRSGGRDVGTDVEYARRIELGFVGTDSLGRHYDQPPSPYLRLAFDENRDAVVREVGDVLRQQLRRVPRRSGLSDRLTGG